MKLQLFTIPVFSKWAFPLLVALVLILTEAKAQTTETFNYTGSMQTWVVPPDVTSVFLEAWGAQGGANWVNNTNFGGYSSGDLAVTPGQTLYIFVGQQAPGTAGGWNGGGNGENLGKGGGGASDIRVGGTTLNDRVLVAGAGGGAGYWSNLHVVGGQGGGLNGEAGYREPSYASNPGGLGGTQTAGGAHGTCVSFNVVAMAGSFGQGGNTANCGCEGYGGGGGWYGGAASGNCRGGGGGSSYIDGVQNGATTQGVRAGHGEIKITYQGQNCPDDDADGVTVCDGDCDDNNPNVYPGFPTNSPNLTNAIPHNPNSVTIYWSNIGGSTNYKFRYRIMGSGDNWSEGTSLRAWRRLFGLSSGTGYEVQFSNYHSGVWTCWSINYYFSTPAAKPASTIKKNYQQNLDDGTLVPLQISPNPSNGEKVRIFFQTGTTQMVDWNLTDLAGKILKNGSFHLLTGKNDMDLNLTDLPAGVYFFKAPMLEGMQAVKLVVE